jgi:hypothetical protein
VHEKQCGNGVTSPSLLVEVKNGKLYIKFGLLLFNANVAKNSNFLKHFTHSWFWQWQSLTMDSFIRSISLHGCWSTRNRLEKSIYIYIWIFFLGEKKTNKISTTEDEPLIMSLACNCCINYFGHMEKDTNKNCQTCADAS